MEFSFDPQTRLGAEWCPGLVGDVFADRRLCGRSVNHGLLRFHDAASAPPAQDAVDGMFRTRGLGRRCVRVRLAGSAICGYKPADCGRSTRPDGHVADGGGPRPLRRLDHAWVDVESFERALSVPLAQDFLQPDLFARWMDSAGITQLDFDSCAGATVPGFYGGKREISNLTHDSVEVYLSFTRQLWEHGQRSGPGSPPPHLATVEGQ